MTISALSPVLAIKFISRSTSRPVISRVYFRVSVLTFGYDDFASLLYHRGSHW